ncbi:hypothetical protein [Pseudoalteromonas sp. M58]|uniref:hypothetical protein n=1 Tax=Pseudoalteromonas sp. M58 TaxID=3141534 RepID=UPI00366ECD15
MTQNELTQIMACMEKSGSKGSSLVSLANASGIDSQTLYSYLSVYPDYFVQLPESKNIKLIGLDVLKEIPLKFSSIMKRVSRRNVLATSSCSSFFQLLCLLL